MNSLTKKEKKLKAGVWFVYIITSILFPPMIIVWILVSLGAAYSSAKLGTFD